MDTDQSANQPRSALWIAKLRASIQRHWPSFDADQFFDLPFGSAAVSPDLSMVWVLVETPTSATVGAVAAWLAKNVAHAANVSVLLPAGMDGFVYEAPIWARLGAHFAPGLNMFTLTPTSCEQVGAGSFGVFPEPEPAARQVASTLTQAGLEVVLEAGVIRGEVLGLEVARVVELGHEHRLLAGGADVELGSYGIDIGVGRFDQEIGRMLQSEAVPVEALARTADYVRLNRTVGAGAHPLAQLCRERWLRRAWIDSHEHPSRLVLVEPTIPRGALRDNAVCGVRDSATLRVFSTGVHLDTAAQAADMAARLAADGTPVDDVVVTFSDPSLAKVHSRAVSSSTIDMEIDVISPPWGK